MFAAIHQHTPSAVLVLVGAETDLPDGPIARQIRASDLDSSVVVLGVRDDIPRLLAAADVLLLPSLYEGLPGVVLEACLVGIPALATDLPGVREIATRLKGVYYLPLAETDSEWARLALALPKEAERLCLRRDAMERFGPSVFHIDRAVEAHRELWRGTARERA
jgi:glycosyltransferase involved in cell wall biosynthesis